MARVFPLVLLFVAYCSMAAAYSTAADHLIAQQIGEACAGAQGEIDPSAAIERDLTGDGKEDFVLSHEGIRCQGGGQSLFCGQLCRVLIYVRRDGKLLIEREMLGRGVRVGDGTIPKIHMYGLGGTPGEIEWKGQRFGTAAQVQSSCRTVAFVADKKGIELAGTAAPNEPVCYLLTGLTGEELSIAVIGGQNIVFSIEGVVDALDRYAFKAARSSYRILVGQLMRSNEDEDFRLHVERTGEIAHGPAMGRPQIILAQELLNQLGYEAGVADGVVGPKTRAAVTAFQQNAGMVASGALDDAILRALKEEIASMEAGIAHAYSSADSTGEPQKRAGMEMIAELRPDISCTDRPSEAYAKPFVHLPSGLLPENSQHFYTDGPDIIRIGKEAVARDHFAGGGDDLIYVDGPEVGMQVIGENGGDTIIVCSLGEVSTTIIVGPYDLAADTVVIDPSVLAATFEQPHHIAIHGMNPVNDRVILLLPEGQAPRLGNDLSGTVLPITIGNLSISIYPALVTMSLDPAITDAIVMARYDGTSIAIPPPSQRLITKFESAAQLRSAAVTLANKAPSGPLHIQSCPSPNEIAVSTGAATGKERPTRGQLFSNDSENVVVTTEPTAFHHDAGGGDDTIYAYGPISGTMLRGGSGSDVVILCQPAEDGLGLIVELGASYGTDIDADTVVVMPEMLSGVPDGHRRRIAVFAFTAANDRIILRLPLGMEVAYGDQKNGVVSLRIDNTFIDIHRADNWLNQPFNWESIVLVPEDLIAPDVARPVAQVTSQQTIWRWGTPRTLGGGPAGMAELDIGCATMNDPPQSLAVAQPVHPVNTYEDSHHGEEQFLYFSHGDDLIRIGQTDTADHLFVDAGRGDDTIYLTDVGDGLTALGGSGSDVIVVCSMRAVLLTLILGRPSDRFPDLVVIEPSVFLDVPDSIGRQILLDGFVPANDSLELRVPDGLEIMATGGGIPGAGVALTVGNVTIGIGDAFYGQGRLDPQTMPVSIVPGVQQ